MTDATHKSRADHGDRIKPLVWLMLDERPGHRSQVVGLAQMLGWPFVVKELRFNGANHVANRFLGASLLSLDRGASDALDGPWPDLVVAMGRRCLPVARWVKRQSGGATVLVQLGRKAANLKGAYDLAIVCRHFQLPEDAARLQVVLPPTKVTEESLAEAQDHWPEVLEGMAHPRILLLVGGQTAQHSFTPEDASCLARAAKDFMAAEQGSLAVTTSRRTGSEAIRAILEILPSARYFPWTENQQDNPYLGLLAQADIIIVTGESESMLAEAAAMAKPLYIHALIERPQGPKARLQSWLLRLAKSPSATPLRALSRWLIDQGLIAPPRDLKLMHSAMVEAGYAQMLGDRPQVGLRRDETEREVIVGRVRALLPARLLEHEP